MRTFHIVDVRHIRCPLCAEPFNDLAEYHYHCRCHMEIWRCCFVDENGHVCLFEAETLHGLHLHQTHQSHHPNFDIHHEALPADTPSSSAGSIDIVDEFL